MAAIQKFQFQNSPGGVAKLREKLSQTLFPDELEDATWDYGVPLQDVKRVAAYWRDDFDWKKFEDRINKLPNYKASVTVDGFDPLEIHFVHKRSSKNNAIPLLFLHGWPGSFLEVEKLLPLLINEKQSGGASFHIVAPSLPNHGFSSGVKSRGFGLSQYSEAMHKLMLSLGYDQFACAGGDWGMCIGRVMSQRFPTSLKVCYYSLVPSTPPSPATPWTFVPFLIKHLLKMYTAAESEGLARSQEFQKTGMGYYQLQTTRPQTIGYLLADSPVGLLAWIYEKLRDWTDNYPWTDEEICTWVSMYWFSTAGPAASVRLYYESLRGEFPTKSGGYVPHVKLGLAYFPKEIFRLPKAWGSSLGEVVFEHEHERGGHFASWEVPEGVAGDLQVMFGKGGGAYGAVKVDKN
ncbi:epoxide hydrolase [Halenospora varia]|nr:epoxide hydrolase [Halenospora varia]